MIISAPVLAPVRPTQGTGRWGPSPERSEEGHSVGEYLARWLAHTRGQVRATTYDGYESLVRLYALPSLGPLPLQALGPLDLQELYSALLGHGLASGTVINLHLALTRALGQAVRWGLLAANPAKGAQPPRPRRKEPVVVDAALASRILEVTRETSFELPVALALCTGMRRGEIMGLRWGDLDQSLAVAQVRRTLQPTRGGLVIQEPKTRRSRRSVILPAMLRSYLHRQQADQRRRRGRLGDAWVDSGAVVDRGDGDHLHPDTLSSGWSTFVRRLGLPNVRFHDLRHAHATLLLVAGINPKVVSERLGHASVGITLDTYSHVLPSMQAEAAKAFDSLFGS
jgi:integrase